MQASLPPNVELRGWVSRAELARVYERSSGFVHAARRTSGSRGWRALAAGAPVVALARCGATDIVRPGEDGILVERPDPELSRDAVRRLAARDCDPLALAARARRFSRERFLERLLTAIETVPDRAAVGRAGTGSADVLPEM